MMYGHLSSPATVHLQEGKVASPGLAHAQVNALYSNHHTLLQGWFERDQGHAQRAAQGSPRGR